MNSGERSKREGEDEKEKMTNQEIQTKTKILKEEWRKRKKMEKRESVRSRQAEERRRKAKEEGTSRPKARCGQRYPCPALTFL